jgi:hypothetical protein
MVPISWHRLSLFPGISLIKKIKSSKDTLKDTAKLGYKELVQTNIQYNKHFLFQSLIHVNYILQPGYHESRK